MEYLIFWGFKYGLHVCWLLPLKLQLQLNHLRNIKLHFVVRNQQSASASASSFSSTVAVAAEHNCSCHLQLAFVQRQRHTRYTSHSLAMLSRRPDWKPVVCTLHMLKAKKYLNYIHHILTHTTSPKKDPLNLSKTDMTDKEEFRLIQLKCSVTTMASIHTTTMS